MSFVAKLFRWLAGKGDAIKIRDLKTPEDIARIDDIDYVGDGDGEHLLDVYVPRGTAQVLPTIVSIHGGGWVYGTKEIYQFYGMNLAQRGFCVVNFNYRLAPKSTFPAPLEDINAVFQWMQIHAEEFHIDIGRLFVVGDSAGAQLASQYGAILANSDYAKRFSFVLPTIRIRGMGLNCGVYDPLHLHAGKRGKYGGLEFDYFGPHPEQYEQEMDVLGNLNPGFPPVFVMTSLHDPLRSKSSILVERLKDLNLPHVFREYGQSDKSASHVFHVDIRKAEATRCNDDEIQFFQSLLP